MRDGVTTDAGGVTATSVVAWSAPVVVAGDTSPASDGVSASGAVVGTASAAESWARAADAWVTPSVTANNERENERRMVAPTER